MREHQTSQPGPHHCHGLVQVGLLLEYDTLQVRSPLGSKRVQLYLLLGRDCSAVRWAEHAQSTQVPLVYLCIPAKLPDVVTMLIAVHHPLILVFNERVVQVLQVLGKAACLVYCQPAHAAAVGNARVGSQQACGGAHRLPSIPGQRASACWLHLAHRGAHVKQRR